MHRRLEAASPARAGTRTRAHHARAGGAQLMNSVPEVDVERAVVCRTFFDATEEISLFFEETADCLPAFRGESLDECFAVYQALSRKDFWTQWRRASVAAGLDRKCGQRSGERTPILDFCRANGIGPAYLSRLARTYRTFNQRPLDPGIIE